MAQVGEARSVAVSFLGKIKTISQMIAIPMLLYHERFLGLDIEAIGTVLIFAAAFLTLWSMFYYLRRAWPRLSSEGRRG
jgi:phosphatidylglycerophosphate synthase